MQITPITNYNPKSQNNSFKGSVGYDISNYLVQKSKGYEKSLASLNVEKYPTIKLLWESSKTLADSTLKNLETLMSQFGKSCVLHWYPIFDDNYIKLTAKKIPVSPDADVFIESADSKYKHYCGKISTNLYDIHKFSIETMTNLDPAVINNKFKLWSISPTGDDFAPEKVIANFNDILIDERTDKPVGEELLEKLYNESIEYDKEFGVKS